MTFIPGPPASGPGSVISGLRGVQLLAGHVRPPLHAEIASSSAGGSTASGRPRLMAARSAKYWDIETPLDLASIRSASYTSGAIRTGTRMRSPNDGRPGPRCFVAMGGKLPHLAPQILSTRLSEVELLAPSMPPSTGRSTILLRYIPEEVHTVIPLLVWRWIRRYL